MRDFGFRVKITLRLIWNYLYAQIRLQHGPYWHYEWLKRDIKCIWECDLNSYYCCSGFDSYGMVGCGCYGMNYREYWEDFTK